MTVKAGEAKAVLLQRVDLEKASFHFSAAMSTSGAGKGGFGGMGGMGSKGAFAQLGVPPMGGSAPRGNARSPARPAFGGVNKASPAKGPTARGGVARASPARPAMGGRNMVKKVVPKKNIIKGK